MPFLLFSWAQQHVTSGLASIYNATTPIMTAVMAGLLFRVERLKALQIVGIVVGILGVVVIIAPWQGLDLSQSLVAQFAILGATACYGFSLAYMRKFVSNTGMTALVFSFLNIGIAAVDHARADAGGRCIRRSRSTPGSSAACSLLGCLGTGVAYIWNQNTVRAWGPTRASTVTYITPDRRRRARGRWSSARPSAGTSRSEPSSSSSASCSRRTACGCPRPESRRGGCPSARTELRRAPAPVRD